MSRGKKEVILYEETYHKGAMTVNRLHLPILRHTSAGFGVVSCELRKAGRVRRSDGQELEYQDLRVYLQEETATAGEAAEKESVP